MTDMNKIIACTEFIVIEASFFLKSGTVLKENDPKTHEIRRNIFDRFFHLKHTVSVATNGEQLNRECSLFTDDGK